MRALRARGPLHARGVAGPAMRAEGVEAIFPAERLGVMGVGELLGHLLELRAARAALVTALREQPDALVCVDAPDFHLPVATLARRRRVATVGYVAPQVWAWRPGRIPTIEAAFDRILCLFDWEPALFPNTDALWVGHPAVDRVRPRDPAQIDRSVYGLLPGSRRQELRRHVPLFLAAAGELRRRAGQQNRPAPRFRLVLPGDVPTAALGTLPPWVERLDHVSGLTTAAAALTKSGTVTLELALLGVPMVVAHRVSPLTWLIGRALIHGVQHISLPNILADREGLPAPVPEHIQPRDPAGLAAALLALPERQEVPLGALGGPGQAARAAEAVAALWEAP